MRFVSVWSGVRSPQGALREELDFSLRASFELSERPSFSHCLPSSPVSSSRASIVRFVGVHLAFVRLVIVRGRSRRRHACGCGCGRPPCCSSPWGWPWSLVWWLRRPAAGPINLGRSTGRSAVGRQWSVGRSGHQTVVRSVRWAVVGRAVGQAVGRSGRRSGGWAAAQVDGRAGNPSSSSCSSSSPHPPSPPPSSPPPPPPPAPPPPPRLILLLLLLLLGLRLLILLLKCARRQPT